MLAWSETQFAENKNIINSTLNTFDWWNKKDIKGWFSPSLSVHVVTKEPKINANGNNSFWDNKIYIKKDKLILGENIIIFWADFLSSNYNNIKDFVENDILYRLTNDISFDIDKLIVLTTALYYYDVWWLWSDYKKSILFKVFDKCKEANIYDPNEITYNFLSETNITKIISDFMVLYSHLIWKEINTNILYEWIEQFKQFEYPTTDIFNLISEIQWNILLWLINKLNFKELTVKILTNSKITDIIKQYFLSLKEDLSFYLDNNCEDNNEYKQYTDEITKINYIIDCLNDSTIEKDISKTDKISKFLLNMLKEYFFVDTFLTEGKILLEKVPVSLWEYVLISEEEYNRLPEKEQKLLIKKLNEYRIPYEFYIP